MKTLLLCVTLISALGSFSAAPVAAQQNTLDSGPFARENQATISVVIPFGGTRQKSEARPRLEFQMREYRRDDLNFNTFQQREITRQRAIGFTIQKKPDLIVNGASINRPDDSANLSTGAAIGIGVAATLGALVIFGKAFEDSLTD